MIDAATAERIGLIEESVPAADLEEHTMKIANKIASKSPVALQLTKEALRAAEKLNIDDGIVYERDLFAIAFSTEDKVEGVRAFLEKETPEWRGR